MSELKEAVERIEKWFDDQLAAIQRDDPKATAVFASKGDMLDLFRESDDDAPIDEAFLRSMGFDRNLTINITADVYSVNLCIDPNDGLATIIDGYDSDGTIDLPVYYKTRRQLRHLLAALTTR